MIPGADPGYDPRGSIGFPLKEAKLSRLIRRVFAVPVALALVVLAGAVVSAATSVNGSATAKFSVPVTVSVSQGAGGTCPGGLCDFGAPALGVVTPALQEDLVLNSNDPNGFSLSISSPSAALITESGCASPNTANTTSSDIVLYQGQSVTGQSAGTGGLANISNFNGGYYRLSTTPTDLFNTDPTAIGTSMDNLVNIKLDIPATARVNSFGCSYTIPWTITVSAK
jgi:hypothetical protein